MPQSNEPIKKRPKVEDTSTGDPDRIEKHEGKPHEEDRSVAGKGSEKGGLNKDAGVAGSGDSDEARGTKGTHGESTHGK